jgi:hypothetical protein
MLKLVAVLWVSTPLSPQRAMHQPILSGNPFYAQARTKYLSIKPLKLGGVSECRPRNSRSTV